MEHSNTQVTGNPRVDGMILMALVLGNYMTHITEGMPILSLCLKAITGIGATFYAINQINIFITNRRNRHKK